MTAKALKSFPPEDQLIDDKKDVDKKNLPGHLLETIDPPKKLTDIISYLELGAGALHPIEKAERHVDYLSMDFEQWLNDDIAKLNNCWDKLKSQIENPKDFLEFNKALHVIKGNAGILNNDETGELASILSRLVERTCKLNEHIETIELLIKSINICSKTKQKDEEMLQEVKRGFDEIINCKIAKI